METPTPVLTTEKDTSQFPQHQCAGSPFRVPRTVSKEAMKRIIVLRVPCLEPHTSALLKLQRGRATGFTRDALLGSNQEKYTHSSLLLHETNSFRLHLVLC